MALSLDRAQALASNPAHSVWVNANAGTGKTKVLTERVLRLLVSGVEHSHILCLTYTNAGANEMRERVLSRLKAWHEMPNEVLVESLKNMCEKPAEPHEVVRAKALFHTLTKSPLPLAIQTIHSFCLNLLAQFPLEAGLLPAFTLMSDRERQDALDDAVHYVYAQLHNTQADDALKNSLHFVSTRYGDSVLADVLAETVSGRIDLSHSEAHYSATLTEVLSLHESVQESFYSDQFMQNLNIEKLKHAALILGQGTASDKSRAQSLLSVIQGGYGPEWESVFYTQLGALRKPSTFTTQKTADAQPLMEQFQLQTIALKEQHAKCRLFHHSMAWHALSQALHQKYEAIKKQRNAVDYNDAISLAHALLTHSETADWVRYKLDNRIHHLLIDEAQDTSPKQWGIIKALMEEFFAGEGAAEQPRTLFVVGDEKQSIYSFQGADVSGFHVMREWVDAKMHAAQKPFEHVAMQRSYRSAAHILGFVDAMFAHPERHKSVAHAASIVKHEAFRTQPSGLVSVLPQRVLAPKQERVPWPIPKTRQPHESAHALLAEQVADTCETLLSRHTLASKGRNVLPGDIMILVRSRDARVDALYHALNARNIPTAGLDRLNVIEHIAVKDLIALGIVMHTPLDDLSLACVLKSPLFEVSESQLFSMCHAREGALVDNMPKDITEAFNALRDNAARLTPHQFFVDVIERLNMRVCYVQRLGGDVNGVLDAFTQLALQYEASNTPSMRDFLEWVTKNKHEIKRDMDQTQNVVRILTVHGSKGLEAPIVICADTGRVPTSNKKILLHDAQKNITLWPGKADNRTLYGKNILNHAMDAEYDEFLRLLYVASTRAEDVLICAPNPLTPSQAKIIAGCWFDIATHTMQQLGVEADDEGFCYGNKDEVLPQRAASQSMPMITERELPTTLQQLTPKMIAQQPYEETASENAEQNAAMERGEVLHKVMEHYVNKRYNLENIAEKVGSFLESEGYDEPEFMVHLTQFLQSDQASLLSHPHAKAEVPLAGYVNGRLVNMRLDTLVVTEGDCWIIDYKTDQNVPLSANEVAASYVRQMQHYTQLVQLIYPQKNIRTVLLYLKNFTWIELDAQASLGKTTLAS